MMKRFLITLTAMTAAAALMVPAFAEETTATTEDDTALSDARSAYQAAKKAASESDYEDELNAMVEAGSLTQDQADLLLNASREAQSLADGVCPNCGYEFQYSATGKAGRGFGRTFGSKGSSDTTDATAEDETSDAASALEQAQEAYASAKQASRITEYEDELNAMVEAGTLTQDQADLLLNAAREAQSLADGVCPNCGYEFQTVTDSVSGRNGGRNGNGGKNGAKTGDTMTGGSMFGGSMTGNSHGGRH